MVWQSVTSSLTIALIIFLFFKQKTAYEMRISDWSSDVCSSDRAAAALAGAGGGDPRSRIARARGLGQARLFHGDRRGEIPGSGRARRTAQARGREIRRATCRDSVCKYV